MINKELLYKVKTLLVCFLFSTSVLADSLFDFDDYENEAETKQSRQLELEAAKMAKQRREMRAEMARLRKEMKERGVDASSSSPDKKSTEGRFATLDRLLEKELISKEEYELKREQILNEI